MPWATRALRAARDVRLVPMTRTVEIETPRGTARASSSRRRPSAALVIGHGPAAELEAPDLLAARDAALDQGMSRPRRAALSRRREALPTVARTLDEAWIAVVEHLRASELEGFALDHRRPLAGARVACRTIEETGAAAVICLFPLEPPARRGSPRAACPSPP